MASHASALINIDWNNFLAGTAGGVVSTAVFHPLELIKVRWQVYENASLKRFIKANPTTSSTVTSAPPYRPSYRSLIDTLVTIYKSENGFRGLYRGLAINTFASGSAWGFYFLIYNGLKARDQQLKTESKKLGFLNLSLDATIAGILTVFITNPLFLLKTRMCLQYSNIIDEKSLENRIVKYKNSWHALKVLVKSDGILGIYKGIIPGLFGTLNGTIQIVTYDLMKSGWLSHLEAKALKQKSAEKPELDTVHFSLFSGLSKILAVVCTYPFQLIKARIQDQHQNYKSLFDVIHKTYKNEKFYGFYKGLIPALIRVTPAASVTFIVYENVQKLLKNF
jgi:solute carrier family 25 (mitochondrial folate transporter), member 32